VKKFFCFLPSDWNPCHHFDQNIVRCPRMYMLWSCRGSTQLQTDMHLMLEWQQCMKCMKAMDTHTHIHWFKELL
jgi:hypothetical protein